MTLNFQTEQAIRDLCHELPAALDRLAGAIDRQNRKPSIITVAVPASMSAQKLMLFAEAMQKAMGGKF